VITAPREERTGEDATPADPPPPLVPPPALGEAPAPTLAAIEPVAADEG
jgi:hypothetical protein